MKLKDISDYLNQRHKLSLRNVRSGHEVWHIFVSRMNLILAFLASVLIIFVLTLTIVAYTPILDLIPGYPGNRSRIALIESIQRLDSLEVQVRRWENFQNNLTLILQGRTPESVARAIDSTERVAKGRPVRRSKSDTLLRMQMTSDSTMVLRKDVRKRQERSFEMMQPVRGQLKESFAPSESRYGVEIAAQPSQVVMAVMDGTVISTPWNPEKGYTITIQHAGNMSSTYSNINTLMQKVGQRVRAGGAIGITPGIKNSQLPTLYFELWYNGNAVDPENYITF